MAHAEAILAVDNTITFMIISNLYILNCSIGRKSLYYSVFNRFPITLSQIFEYFPNFSAHVFAMPNECILRWVSEVCNVADRRKNASPAAYLLYWSRWSAICEPFGSLFDILMNVTIKFMFIVHSTRRPTERQWKKIVISRQCMPSASSGSNYKQTCARPSVAEMKTTASYGPPIGINARIYGHLCLIWNFPENIWAMLVRWCVCVWRCVLASNR